LPKNETITLVGGPGDGTEIKWERGDSLQWNPVEDLERVTARTMGRPISVSDPITYVRSRRTRNLFVYQP
jgi:hypothetical protein